MKKNDDKILNKKKLYGFQIVFVNKTRCYYSLSLEERDKWVSSLERSIGY